MASKTNRPKRSPTPRKPGAESRNGSDVRRGDSRFDGSGLVAIEAARKDSEETKPMPPLSERPLTLSEKEWATLRVINHYSEDKGFSPSLRELCRATGVRSTSVMAYRIMRLQIIGVIDVQRMIARSVVITAAGKQLLQMKDAEQH